MDIEIRTIRDDEFDDFVRALNAAFSGEMRPDELELERRVSEPDRTLAAFDGDEIIGGAAAVSFELTVPGGVIPSAGVTSVGVKPTHRRRGVNSALMRRQLDDIRAGDEPLAVLYASEGGIYGRFGYGLGSFMATIDLEEGRSAFIRGYRPAGRVRLLERGPAFEAMAAVYERVRPESPGMLARTPDWWEIIFQDAEHNRDGASPYFFALHESDEGLDGYAVYRVKHDWPGEISHSVMSVDELVAVTPRAYADMWRYCFDVDLVSRVKCWNRPVDDPLLYLLAEPRRLRMTVRDGLFVRLVDLPKALEARRYATADRITLEVRDEFCPWNDGRYALEGGPDGAVCGPTTKTADLALSVTDLGASYLGGAEFPTLARAGRVVEETPGALRRADAMFRSDPAPWCPNMF
ncbi:MAG: GNAT family N-acetyltransferase [Actinomycetota bacterium]